MARNAFVLVGLVLAQLGTAYLLQVAPDLVSWSWQIRLALGVGIVFSVGVVASLLFMGAVGARIGWVAISTALPPVIAEWISWSDPAYPNMGYLVAIVMATVASLGALVALTIRAKRSPSP